MTRDSVRCAACGGVRRNVVGSLSTYIRIKYHDLPVAVNEESRP